MSKIILIVAAAIGIGGALLCWSAGEIGYSFRGPGYERSQVVGPGAGQQLVVSITQGDIAAGSKSNFSEQLTSLLENMNEHDGLVGYSVRKQLFGARVWTMSVWLDEDSLSKFVNSPAHRKAVAAGGIPRESIVYTSLRLPSERIPLTWTEAKRILAESNAKQRTQ